ncbi:type I-B CRISPR-associated protein Cas5 [Clostridium autoethanogenum]|uniref:Type I-B CRISPR-associated protein Cas5 n=1 Tax=Clostridium autoethanogenum TaxID=84023 RepID=A0A3M0SUQ8_9CLOT|nr:type I-B CRISPR-associated protein Cas5b [Clostridium autoethanogenum]RMD02174.1 type I-B CRISPR-associated protein Cas5 [Clostridium autoethanogenum]
MDLLILKVKGKFAHFRKFYTNSSSLSYSVPPRTTVIGLIAAVLGYERDSYYELFSRDNFNVSIKKDSCIRKIMQSVNYIKATSPKSIFQPKDHTQIPVEILTGDDGIKYTIYINCGNKNLMNELEYRIKNNKYVYSPYLGAAPFNCTFQFCHRFDVQPGKSKKLVQISTLINSKYIATGSIDIFENDNLKLLKERMPVEFLKDREVGDMASYIYDENGHPLKLKLNTEFIKLKDENIVFM